LEMMQNHNTLKIIVCRVGLTPGDIQLVVDAKDCEVSFENHMRILA